MDLATTGLRAFELASCHITYSGRSFAHLSISTPAGNTLECLNLALDHFDQTHLDRYLKISGQAGTHDPDGVSA